MVRSQGANVAQSRPKRAIGRCWTGACAAAGWRDGVRVVRDRNLDLLSAPAKREPLPWRAAHMREHLIRVLFACAGALACCMPLSAQCSIAWVPLSSGTGLNGPAHASVWHTPAAPLPARVLVGGEFTAAGSLLASNIAAWDPATNAWSTLGAGIAGRVYALTTLSNGDVIAAGQFAAAGGVPANNIARWNGATWSAFGGLAGPVYALATLANGTLVAGGQGGVAAWNGTTWTTLGGTSVGLVSALAPTANGELIVGGAFTTTGGAPGNGIARWDGVAWHAMGSGMSATPMPPFPPQPAHVQSLAVLANGDIVAGGDFSMAGGVPASNVARWNGSSWAPLGAGTSDTVKVIR